MRNAKSLLVIVLTLMLVATACSSNDDASTGGPDGETSTTTANGSTGATNEPSTAGETGELELVSNNASQPLNIQLGEGQAAVQIEGEGEPAKPVEGEPIDDPQVEAILERLPELDDEPTDTQEDFNRPPETLRPPTSGTRIEQDFPAGGDDPAPEVAAGPLEVLRFQPEGSVPLAPYLSVTFNQPMVPLGTLGQLDTDDVPVTLTPDIPGHWEWIGTRTLRFESDSEGFDRLPMASSYTATVPAGTTSQSGNALEAEVTWTFETPAPQLKWLTPESDSLRLDPIFIGLFDQQVDQSAVLDAITLTAAGESRSIRLATADEVGASQTRADEGQRSTEDLPADRWIAFTPTEPLPTDAAIVVTVGPNVPSTEGPIVNPEKQSFTSRTYAPLQVDRWDCGRRCQPLRGFSISFNNPLDEAAFDESLVTVSPEIPGMRIRQGWNTISIAGATKGDTKYKVTVSGVLTDIFGQTLGDDQDHEFKVEDADPFIGGFEGDPVVLDPMAENPKLTIPVMNHDKLRIRVREVTPDDWRPYIRWRNRFDDNQNPPPSPGREIANDEIDTNAEKNELTYVDIDLGEYLDGDVGQIVVIVEPTGNLANIGPTNDLYWTNRPQRTWAQHTNIGLDTYNDGRDVVVFTTALDTGEALADVTVELTSSTQTFTTGADGTARVPIEATYEGLVARKGDDVVWLWGGGEKRNIANSAQWYVIDDRGIYKPGETVRVKGWLRLNNIVEDGQLQLPNTESVTWSVTGPQGNELATGTSDLSPLGGFDATFDLPAGTNLGQAWMQVQTGRARYQHAFQVQEFRRPEFEVSARNETPGPYFTTEPATVAVEANYFSGGPLPNAQVDWTVETQRTTYRPPNWDDFTFGRWVPWWYGNDSSDFDCCGNAERTFEQYSGTTDATGSHYLKIGFGEASPDTPSTVTANAAVMDVNRQVWSADTSLLVHAGQNYVGLQGAKTFVRRGDPLDVEAIVTDIDGNTVGGVSYDVVAEVLEWKQVDGEWVEVGVNPQTCPLTSTNEAQSCTFETNMGGRYRISAVVSDATGGRNRTELTRWVSGGTSRPSTRVERESAELVPDKETYQPGDTAEILVQSPFGPAEGLLILSRNRIVETRRFTIDGDTTVLDIAIDDAFVPNLDVRVELTGTAPRLDDDGEPLAGAKPRPAFAGGQLSLRIPPISRTLDVVTTPASDAVEPGDETTIDVAVMDGTGAPVEGAELVLVVVDEAVLALSGYELTNPIETFYRPLKTNLIAGQTRQLVRLSRPELPDFPAPQTDTPEVAEGDDEAMEEEAMEALVDDAAEPASASALVGVTAARQKASEDGSPIEVRANFDALAVFEPELTTAADGTATMAFTMPDNLTRYRVMVVAVSNDDHFGSGESNITARLPLQVRPSAPRFLNFGDVFELPVVVQNQTDEDMIVDVVLEATNLKLTGPAGQTVTVPANDRVEVRFGAAADQAGTARFRAAAVSGASTDAATVSLPVYTPATSEAFATYGVVDDGAVFQPILGPEAVWRQFGGLEINTSSTAVQALTDAIIYVNDYPYRSSDAAASHILSIAALRDVLGAFDAEGLPSQEELDQSVRQSIDTIAGLQNRDGGFPYWSRGRESIPYHSVHVAHALVVARQAGFDVPSQTYGSAMQFLGDIENYYDQDYSPTARDTISAYALHVRALNGDRDTAKAANLYNNPANGELSLDATAWLYPVIDDAALRTEITRTFNNQVTETAAGATFVTNYSDDDYVLLHSNRRTDGIVLNALISQDPDSDLIAKVVNGLLANKTKGRWGNLQENTFILLALNEYFDTFEDVEPDFVARVWLGGTYAAEHTYKGRTTEQNQTVVPMSVLVDEGDTNVVLQKTGAGRLYYRLGLDYAPENLNLEPLDRGFVVQRTYEAVNDPEDVWKDDDGTWHVKLGAEVRVTLDMTTDSRRTHVALNDPLPAGLEILNPELAPTETFTNPNSGGDGWYWWQWFNHQNLRDDRAEAFTNYLRAGTYEYSYIARATTPGTFVVPPTKAEEMYAPETFGRSGTNVLIVEAE